MRFFRWLFFGILLSLFPIYFFKRSVEVHGQSSTEKILFLYNWAEYFPEDVLETFEKETGIHVVCDYFASSEELEAKLFAGCSGYDLAIVPAFPVLQRGIGANLFIPLKEECISNKAHVDAKLLEKIANADPKMQFSVPYLWGTTGIVYDADRIPRVESWNIFFDPKMIASLASHRPVILDAAVDVFQAALLYLKEDPCSKDPKVWKRAAEAVMKIRPFIFLFQEGSYIKESLFKGDSSLGYTYSSYANQLKKNPKFQYKLPKEGGIAWLDVFVIPQGAVHVSNAHRFLQFVLQPHIMAKISESMRVANLVPASYRLLSKELRQDRGIFPPVHLIHSDFCPDIALLRLISRWWLKIKMNHPI